MAKHGAATATAERDMPEPAGVDLTLPVIEEFLVYQQQKGCTSGTLLTYRKYLLLLYDYLPESKRLERGTLNSWQAEMLENGYAERTVNVRISAANSLLEYLDRRDLQTRKLLEPSETLQPELTRTEYLRLLSTARVLGKERTYLLVKLFGAAGLTIQELPKVTVEAVKAGKLVLSSGEILYIPECLRKELLDYAKRAGVASGLIFITRDGKAIHRSYISMSIRNLCRDAQVPEEKGNTRCLHQLYQTTRAGIVSNISIVMEQAYERLLEMEQTSIGWDNTG